MRLGHHAVASPIAIGTAWGEAVAGVNIIMCLVCAGVIIYSSTWNDLDHPRFKGKYHPGAALVRGTGRLGYMIRTERDKDRDDVHRGPSHCIEWCLLAGLTVGGICAAMPPLAGWAVWLGLAVFIGTISHVLADATTPSGVPLCALYNYIVHKEVWMRHKINPLYPLLAVWNFFRHGRAWREYTPEYMFSTDSAGEKFLTIPAMFGVSGIMLLAMLGWLAPLTHWLVAGLL